MMPVEQIARVCHEVNRAYCEAIGDQTQKSWEEAEEWQRVSAVDGVRFKLENPGVTPEQQHNNWSRVKIEAGWIYGPVKDPSRKEHPCLVPYNQLPREQQVKDHLFGAVVKALAV